MDSGHPATQLSPLLCPVDVLIPYRRTESRARGLYVVQDYYAERFPAANLIVCDDPTGEPFATGRAVNAALLQATAPVVIYQDADSLVQPQALRACVERAVAGGMHKAFTRYCRLSPSDTAAMEGWRDPWEWGRAVWEQEPVAAMGVSAVNREDWLRIGGFDPRFNGWGYDDIALETLAGATIGITREPGYLWHMYHERRPNGEEDDTSPTFQANAALNAQYAQRTSDPRGLLALRWEVEWAA